jgi:SAM-dependent methyltransferase
LKQLLSSPHFYNALQNLLSGPARRRKFYREILQMPEKGRVLDIGCGTANGLACLSPSIEYVGFDASAPYIEYARRKYADRNAEFHQEIVEKADLSRLGRFDVVIATGILHHLGDEAAIRLFELAQLALRDGGTLITLDPCFIPDQHPISRRMVGNDRGEFVRTLDRYPALARSVFGSVRAVHRSDLLRIPYDHCVMFCRESSAEPIVRSVP